MKLKFSETMKEHLRFMQQVNGGPNARCAMPTHHENRVTHAALVRRGAIQTDAEGYWVLTPTGEAAIA